MSERRGSSKWRMGDSLQEKVHFSFLFAPLSLLSFVCYLCLCLCFLSLSVSVSVSLSLSLSLSLFCLVLSCLWSIVLCCAVFVVSCLWSIVFVLSCLLWSGVVVRLPSLGPCLFLCLEIVLFCSSFRLDWLKRHKILSTILRARFVHIPVYLVSCLVSRLLSCISCFLFWLVMRWDETKTRSSLSGLCGLSSLEWCMLPFLRTRRRQRRHVIHTHPPSPPYYARYAEF